MTYNECFNSAPIILNECSTSQRMAGEFGYNFDPILGNCTWIYDDKRREGYAKVYREYFSVAEKYNLPLMSTPANRWGHKKFIEKSKFKGVDITHDNIDFVRGISKEFNTKIFIGCIEGTIGDQYIPEEQITIDEAYSYHLIQLDSWVQNNPDFLYTGIMPEINETIGMAKAFSDTGIPYNVGFIITNSGCLLDGTPLDEAIKRLDDSVENAPIQFMANCIHPTNLLNALQKPFNQTENVRKRLCGTISNASMLKPCELEGCEHIDNASPTALVDAMIELYDYHKFKVMGGCCGTNNLHMEEIATRLVAHVLAQ